MDALGFLVKIFISLLVFGSFLFGFLLVMRKRGMFLPVMNGNNIQIVSHTKLTPKAHIFLVQIDHSKFIIGVTEGNISFYQMKEKESN